MEHGAQDHDVERLQGLRIIRREITNVEGSPLGKYSACTLHIARVWFKPVIIHIRQVSEDVPGATTNIEHSANDSLGAQCTAAQYNKTSYVAIDVHL
jgi:hypothetical protein